MKRTTYIEPTSYFKGMNITGAKKSTTKKSGKAQNKNNKKK